LQVEGVSVVDPDARQRVGSRTPEREFGPLVAVYVEEGEFFAL
jgi:hypothetical protein